MGSCMRTASLGRAFFTLTTVFVLSACGKSEPERRFTRCEGDLFLVDGQCVELPPCEDAFYEAPKHVYSSSRGCRPITRCGPFRYEVTPPTRTSDRICKEHVMLCTHDEYESTIGTETTARVCSPISTCEANEYEQALPTKISDRICLPVTECTSSQWEQTRPTPTSDRVCSDTPVCLSGQAPADPEKADTDELVCCFLQTGGLRLSSSSTWPSFDEECLVVYGDVSVTGPALAPVPLLRIEGNLSFSGYDSTNLSAFSTLETITGGLSISENSTNLRPDFTELAGLDNLSFVGGNLDISFMKELSTLRGLEGLTTLQGSLRIAANEKLTSLDGLQNLVTIDGDVSISVNAELKDIAGFGALESIGGALTVQTQSKLTHISGFPRLKSIHSDLLIDGNGELESISGLGALESIHRDFIIRRNTKLTDILGFSALSLVERDFKVTGNYTLCDAPAYALLTQLLVAPSGTDISDNSILADYENACAD